MAPQRCVAGGKKTPRRSGQGSSEDQIPRGTRTLI